MKYTLTVATSEDGFIGRSHAEPPWTWASKEEQDVFFAEVDAADWSIMGRITHETADRPDRRRIVFSSGAGGWKRDAQLWVDPAKHTPYDLPSLVNDVRPMGRGLILGGTRVHDWFLAHNAIDEVHLTVEPVRFTQGLPVFTGQEDADVLAIFAARGFQPKEQRLLNKSGTRYLVMRAD